MKLMAIGVGTYFSMKNWQTNFLFISDSGRKLLFDCGLSFAYALNEQGMSAKDVDDIYISHYHGDHMLGLEWMGFAKYFDPTQERPNLYCMSHMEDNIWATFRQGMKSVQGKILSLRDYFDVKPIEINETFEWEGATFRPVQMCHVMDGYAYVPCFGCLVSVNGKTIFMTADTQHQPQQIHDFYNMSDIIIHDCETLVSKDGKFIKSRVHAHYDDLRRELPEETKSKMWLVHYDDQAPDNFTPEVDGFLGFVKKGQVFDF